MSLTVATSTPSPTGTFTHYEGLPVSIPSSSSPGLLFLASIFQAGLALYPLPASPTALANYRNFFTPDARIILKIFDATEPQIKTVDELIKDINKPPLTFHLQSSAKHEIIAWDLDHGDGRRTLFVESVFAFHLNQDRSQTQITNSIIVIYSIEVAPEGKGDSGFWVKEYKSYMDGSSIFAKYVEIFLKSHPRKRSCIVQ